MWGFTMQYPVGRAKGLQTRPLKTLSNRGRTVLSILCLTGLVFFGCMSLFTKVTDPESLAQELARRGLRTKKTAPINVASETQTGQVAKEELKLLLATHNRLLWYFTDSDTVQVVHEAQGVHYGVFPGAVGERGNLDTVWNVIRPHNWHPKTSEEFLVELDVATGSFAALQARRGNKVFICDTEGGQVLQLRFPGLELERQMHLFTKRQHINTLAPVTDDQLWVLLHNLGKSEVVKLDITGDKPREIGRIKDVGTKAHGLVLWQNRLVILDSEGNALVTVDPENGTVTKVWEVPEGGKFLKGLAVVDDVAYFGVSVWQKRESRDSEEYNSQLAAVDLTNGQLLWRREVPTHGLLNIVAAPHLGENSTYVAQTFKGQLSQAGRSTEGVGDTAADGGVDSRADSTVEVVVELDTGSIADASVRAATEKLSSWGYKPLIGGHWSSGRPYLQLEAKDTRESFKAGLQLPLLQVNVSALQAKLLSLPDSIWDPADQRMHNAAVDGRKDNMDKFKPGVQALYLVFSDQSTEHVFRFPYYDLFKDEIEPILLQIIGETDMGNVVRMQFARMKPGSIIKMHRDMGGYAKASHRIHIPVITHANVSFEVCPELEKQRLMDARNSQMRSKESADESECLPIPMAEGMVFEVNNRVLHRVFNRSPISRVQLVVDIAEKPKHARTLKPGTICNYIHADMVCPESGILSTTAQRQRR